MSVETIMTDVHYLMLVELDETLKKEFGNLYNVLIEYRGSTLRGEITITQTGGYIKEYKRAVEILSKLYCK